MSKVFSSIYIPKSHWKAVQKAVIGRPGGYAGKRCAEGSERGARGCSGGIIGTGVRGGVGRTQQEGIKCPLFYSTTVTALPHYGECGGSMWIYLQWNLLCIRSKLKAQSSKLCTSLPNWISNNVPSWHHTQTTTLAFSSGRRNNSQKLCKSWNRNIYAIFFFKLFFIWPEQF